jgi:hypothetical protein
VGSMGNRLAECIKKGGDKTRYWIILSIIYLDRAEHK